MERLTRTSLLDVLRTTVAGDVLTTGRPGYDEGRTPYFRHRVGTPVAVVRPRDTDDVAAVVAAAREAGTDLAVRGGGHSVRSTGDGLVLDLGALDGVRLESRTAWVGGGATTGAVAHVLGRRGLAVGFGDTASVGVGGLSLGGGTGFLSRLHGLTVDSVTAAEVVTADGRVRTVDSAHEPDLFWALRGGGGNFGVVTRFRYRTVPVPQVYGGTLLLPATAPTVSDLVALCLEADERLTVIANLLPAPPAPGVPPELVGTLVVAARVAWAGTAADGAAVMRPLGSRAAVNGLRPVPYAELLEEAPDRGARPAVRTMFLDRVDEPVAETTLDQLRRAPSWLRMVQLRVLGGAVSRVPVAATAYAHRRNRILVTVVHGDDAGAATASRWAQEVVTELDQGVEGAYVNFLGPDEAHRVTAAYPEPTLTRLRRIKAVYDPENLFRHNVAIPPAAVRPGGLPAPPRARSLLAGRGTDQASSR